MVESVKIVVFQKALSSRRTRLTKDFKKSAGSSFDRVCFTHVTARSLMKVVENIVKVLVLVIMGEYSPIGRDSRAFPARLQATSYALPFCPRKALIHRA